jgi:O-antigen/teichoic acid export membrane protein
VVGAVLSCGLMIAMIRRTRALPSGHETIALAELLNYSIPLFVSALIGGALVGNGLPLVLAAEHGAEVVAVYAIALTTPLLLQMPATALENAAVPVWSAATGKQTTHQLSRSFAEVTRWALLLALLIFVPLTSATRECVTLLFGSDYAETTGLVQMALVATLFSVGVGPTEGMLRAFGATRTLLRARLLGGGAAAAVAWPLVQLWGAPGAVAAWALNEFTANGVCSYSLYRSHGIHPVDSRYVRTLATGASAWLLCAAIAPAVDGMTRLAVVMAVNAFTIGTIGFLVGAWSTAELRRLLRPSAARPGTDWEAAQA